MEEGEIAIKVMKESKAAGSDDTETEVLKLLMKKVGSG